MDFTSEEIKNFIKERFLHLRTQILDKSQTEMAESLGVSQSAIANYENKGSEPSGTVLWKMVKVFRLNPDWLFGASAEPMLSSSIELISTTMQVESPKVFWQLPSVAIPAELSTPDRDKMQKILGDIADFQKHLSQ